MQRTCSVKIPETGRLKLKGCVWHIASGKVGSQSPLMKLNVLFAPFSTAGKISHLSVTSFASSALIIFHV